MPKEYAVNFSFLSMLLVLLLIHLAISTTSPQYNVLPQRVFASSSPSFQRQEVTLGSRDWLSGLSGKPVNNGPDYTDIQSVSYSSNGKYLNATLWLANFTKNPVGYENVNYGMYIDADSNNRTGLDGIDYQIEVHWNEEKKT